jgi:hypothetical protein
MRAILDFTEENDMTQVVVGCNNGFETSVLVRIDSE